MILAGDIGGTRTTLALFEATSGEPGFDRQPAVVETFPSASFASFPEILGPFLARHRAKLSAGCVGVAGPVRDGRAKTTNLPWIVDAAELAAVAGLRSFHSFHSFQLLNDLEAVAYGLDLLRPDELAELQPGAAGASGNRAILAAGTGLGEVGLYWDGEVHRPFATEGGHGDFAPRDELEIGLLRFLQQEHSRVSWERVLSGPGLVAIYRHLRSAARPESKGSDSGVFEDPDPAAAIARRAASGEDPIAVAALERFATIYGAEAGNLALKLMATGGLYLGGGIAPKIRDRLERGPFIESFLAKGRMRPVLEAMPVRVILNPQTALLGAARCAVGSAASQG